MLLITAAVREEIAGLHRLGWPALPPMQVGRWPLSRWRLPEGEVAAVATGVGHQACSDALLQIDTQHRLSGIVAAGHAGALRNGMQVGDVCVAESIVVPGAPTLVPHGWMLALAREAAVRAEREWVFAPALSSDSVLPDAISKRAAGAEHAAAFVDMESRAVAQLAARFAIPWLAVRVISDCVEDDLNRGIGPLLNERGRLRPRAIMREVLLRPGRMREVLRQQRCKRTASNQLADALGVIVPVLLKELGM